MGGPERAGAARNAALGMCRGRLFAGSRPRLRTSAAQRRDGQHRTMRSDGAMHCLSLEPAVKSTRSVRVVFGLLLLLCFHTES